MALRKKNLLEAFQASAPEGPRAAARKGAEKVSAGGPFAPQATLHGAHVARKRPLLARFVSDRTVQVAVVLAVIAVAGAYWLGRKDASKVAAAPASAALEGSTPGALLREESAPSKATPDLATANIQTAQAGNADDVAFMDRANKYTIRLIQYANDEAGLAAATALCEHLRRKEGVPAIRPIAKGKALILVAGFKPKIKDLDGLLEYVRALRGPDPKGSAQPFQDAYVVNIDDLVARP